MEAIGKLILLYNNSAVNDIYHEITGRILKNLFLIQDSTIYDVAQWCYSSPSTISRLVKKIGFESFSDFKVKISTSLNQYNYINRNIVNMQLNTDSDIVPMYFSFLRENMMLLEKHIQYSKIKEITDALNRLDSIFFYTKIDSGIIMLQSDLTITGKKSCILKSFEQQHRNLPNLDESCLVFMMIPDLREMADCEQILKDVYKTKAVTVVICSSVNSIYQKYADYILEFDGTKTSFDTYMFMVIVNLILWDYRNRYVDRLMDNGSNSLAPGRTVTQ